MTKEEIQQGVKEVISLNSRYSIDEIKINDPIDKFISSFFGDRLARELKRKFSKINTTSINNELFTSIKKVSELINSIKSYYEET